MEIRELTFGAIGLRIAMSILLGGVVGLERGLKNRPAGLRTYMLVCVGSCLIMMTNQYSSQVYGTGDPVRMGAQVVSGIGFLGAGTIVVTRQNQIKGLTTAAGLWASAAAGLAIGIGFYEAALLGGGAIFLVLTVLQSWDDRMHRNSRETMVYIELSDRIYLGAVLREIRNMELQITNVQTDVGNALDGENRSFIMTLKSQKKRSHEDLFREIRRIEGVAYLEGL